jgi:hypothetical protein
MNKTLSLRTSLLSALAVAALMALPAAQAANMTRADYSASKTRISDEYKAAKVACASLAGNAKDICVEEGKAKEKVARAELEFAYSGKAGDRNAVLVAQADSAYAVAKEKCDDLAGNAKDVCVKEAKAVKVKALADAKMAKTVSTASTDATQAKRDADYKVAAEKCEALAGDARASCVSAAKVQAGKT